MDDTKGLPNQNVLAVIVIAGSIIRIIAYFC